MLTLSLLAALSVGAGRRVTLLCILGSVSNVLGGCARIGVTRHYLERERVRRHGIRRGGREGKQTAMRRQPRRDK